MGHVPGDKSLNAITPGPRLNFISMRLINWVLSLVALRLHSAVIHAAPSTAFSFILHRATDVPMLLADRGICRNEEWIFFLFRQFELNYRDACEGRKWRRPALRQWPIFSELVRVAKECFFLLHDVF